MLKYPCRQLCGAEQREVRMKATGIVRRIDELGRVVIPKEIRRTLRIKDGDPSLITLQGTTDKKGEISQNCAKLRPNTALLEYLQAKGNAAELGALADFSAEDVFMLALRSLADRGYIKTQRRDYGQKSHEKQ